MGHLGQIMIRQAVGSQGMRRQGTDRQGLCRQGRGHRLGWAPTRWESARQGVGCLFICPATTDLQNHHGHESMDRRLQWEVSMGRQVQPDRTTATGRQRVATTMNHQGHPGTPDMGRRRQWMGTAPGRRIGTTMRR